MNYNRYLKTQNWKEFRERILAERGCCEECGATEDLQVHHVDYGRLGHEAPEDVTVLCRTHHNREHGFPEEDLKEIERELGIYDIPS